MITAIQEFGDEDIMPSNIKEYKGQRNTIADMIPSKTRILFIHNTAMWYRRPFFNLLAQKYPIKYIFTHLNVSKNIYNIELSNKIVGMENLDYNVLKNYFKIAFGVIGESFGNYDVLVGGSWDSLPELIETTFYFSVAKLRRKKFILWTEDWNWRIRSQKRRVVKVFARWIIKNSDAIVVPGNKHKECVIYMGSKPEKIFLMPNASNFSGDENISQKEVFSENPEFKDKKIILFVGRLVEQKGVNYLLKAFLRIKKEIENTVLVIIGKGSHEQELKKIVRDLKIENDVYFLGQIDNQFLKHYYNMSEICVVPSITDNIVDAWAFVVNEAMSCGKPVIASDATGSAFDMIKNGKNGFIVPEKDSQALYDSIKTILSDEELTEEMGKNSKETVENGFRYKNMVEGFSKAIEYLKEKD